MLTENLKIALRAISANKMGSILTVLGVMIGVAAVIAVVSLVQGMQYKISEDLASIGSNYIEVYPDPGEERNPFLQRMPDLTLDDAAAVRRGIASIREFTPIYLANADLKYRDQHHRVKSFGVNEAFQDVFNQWIDHGRFFTPVDLETKKRVAVIGATVVDSLQLGQPLGKEITVDGNGFTVIGVMEKKGGSFGQDQDDRVYIPITTAATLYGTENMQRLILAFQLREGSDLDLAKEQLTEILRTRHRLKKRG